MISLLTQTAKDGEPACSHFRLFITNLLRLRNGSLNNPALSIGTFAEITSEVFVNSGKATHASIRDLTRNHRPAKVPSGFRPAAAEMECRHER